MKNFNTKNCFFFLVVLFPLVFFLNTFYAYGQSESSEIDASYDNDGNIGGSITVNGTPKSKLRQLMSRKRAIVSGFVKLSEDNIKYRITDIPRELDVITVAFKGRPSSCSQISCGSPDFLFNYRNSLSKADYLNDVKKLRNLNRNRIFLYEISEQVLYSNDMSEAYNKLVELSRFIKDYDFDGVNVRIDAGRWNQNINKLEEVVSFYKDYSKKLKFEIGEESLFTYTFTAAGAFSNVGNGRFKKLFIDQFSPYNPDKINTDHKKREVIPYARDNLAGIAIPLMNHMERDIDLVFIAEQYELIPKRDNRVFSHVISAYLHYAELFGFGIHVAYHLNNSRDGITLDNEDLIKNILEQLKRDNSTRSQGNGVTFIGIGARGNMYYEETYVPYVAKLLK